ncbi:MAG TPA: hypothetical protein VHJ20_08960 [Polyangia bacterium]|nr:hypothetical protein [Polyangia bacterium]
MAMLPFAGAACEAPGPSDEASPVVDPAEAAPAVEVARAALTVGDSDGLSDVAYATQCQKTYKVPLPPAWGTPQLGSGQGKWTKSGAYGDSFVNSNFNGTIYYSVDSSTTTPGICVINAHVGFTFDIICQGKNGLACFWEGSQPELPSNPKTVVNLVPDPAHPNNPWGTWGGTETISTPQSGHIATCTTCHEGQNVFLTHNASGHATNLTSKANWMPSTFMQPFVPAAWPKNPDPGTSAYNGLPSGLCLSCHTSTPGGRFPTFTDKPTGSTYCSVLTEVVNRPASAGGMPPKWPDGSTNICTPGVDCARQRDPFVKALLLDNCNTGYSAWPDDPIARSTPGTPSVVWGVSANGPSYKGEWLHTTGDTWAGTIHKTLRFDDFFNQTQYAFSGWSGANDVTGTLPTPYQPAMWLKDANNDGSNLAIMVTKYDGSIVDWGQHGTFKNINTTLAAGAPSPYVRHDGTVVAVYRGYDEAIHEISWNGSSWFQDAPLPAPTGTHGAIGDPIGYMRSPGANGSSSVLYVCKGNDSSWSPMLCEDRLVQGEWWARIIPTTTLGTDGTGDLYQPKPNTTPWGGWYIGYVGWDGPHVIEDSSEPWFDNTVDTWLGGEPHIASAVVPYGDQEGYVSLVYRTKLGSTSTIVERQGSAGYAARTVYTTTTDTLTDDPAAIVAQDPWANTILFRNTKHNVFQAQWNNSTGKYVKSTVF